MSDVGIAPAPSAPPSAPAPQGEVAINPNPVNIPQPIGSQAPPAPVGDVKGDHHPQSRREATREAIRKAFARTEEPGPAKARMGHNQPPEEMKKERAKPKEPPLDLKRRPDDQGGAKTTAYARAEHGHFAARTDTPAARTSGQRQAGPPSQPGQPAPYNVVKLPPGAPYAQSPRRWSERARAEWGAAPESVRASVHQTHKQFSQAMARMQGDMQEFNRIRPYHDMARQHGTTLERALSNYTGMENKLREDPIGGLDVIVQNLNLRTADGKRITLPDIAWHILNQSPEQHQMLQTRNQQTAIAQQMMQMQRQQAALARATQQLHYERQFAHTRRGVDRFAETHPRLDELGDLIQKELRLGFNLPTAYRRAELLRPTTQGHPGSATHAAQTRNTPAQTRGSDRSIHGAPDAASLNGKGKRRGPPPERRETIARAIRHAGGSL